MLQIFLILVLLLFPFSVQAYTKPFGDAYKEARATYQQKVSSYSPTHKQQLDNLQQKIATINEQRTSQLSTIMESQGLLLDEYIKRNKIAQKESTDGISRNLSDPIEKARYWITYAHEAVAYQASKEYVLSLTSEKNIQPDANNLISRFQTDLDSTRNKVINSQTILESLIKQ